MFVKKVLINFALMAAISSPSYGMDGSQPQDPRGPGAPLVTPKGWNEIPDKLLVKIVSPIIPCDNWPNPKLRNLRLVCQRWDRCLSLQPTTLNLVLPREGYSEKLFASFPNLKRVVLERQCEWDHPSVNIPSQLTQLELKVRPLNFANVTTDLNHLTCLKALTLRYSPPYASKFFMNVSLNVSGLTKLKKLSIDGMGVDPGTLSNLTILQALRSINRSIIYKSSLDVQALTQLTELDFRPCRGNDISGLTNLTSLGLYYDGTIPDLSRLTKLKRLNLSHTSSRCDLGKDHKLEELKVIRHFYTSPNFHPVNLEDLTCLRTLSLNLDRITTNEDISHLTNLTSLRLNGTKITDINSLTHLQVLYLVDGDTLPAEGYGNLSNLNIIRD